MMAPDRSATETRVPRMRDSRFVILLIALTMLLVVTPIISLLGQSDHPRIAPFLLTVCFIVVILAAVFAVSQTRSARIVAIALAAPAIVFQVLVLWMDVKSVSIPSHTLGMVLILHTIIAILRHLFLVDHVTVDTICASLCAYLLIGVLWALAYSLLGIIESDTFRGAILRFGGGDSVTVLYYSFVTMSTLGYGDIVPISPTARMLAMLQAVGGQLYLVVLVARLVGLHIAHAVPVDRNRRHEIDGPQSDR